MKVTMLNSNNLRSQRPPFQPEAAKKLKAISFPHSSTPPPLNCLKCPFHNKLYPSSHAIGPHGIHHALPQVVLTSCGILHEGWCANIMQITFPGK